MQHKISKLLKTLNSLVIPIFVILISSLFFVPLVNSVFAEDESEKKRLEEIHEQEKKAREKIEEEQKTDKEQAKEQQKKFNENLRKLLKLEFDDDFDSENIADWVLIGTLVLITGVIGSTGYKIIKPKKQNIISKK